MDGAVQRMMNIKIAKAFRTLSYEASCVLAAIEEEEQETPIVSCPTPRRRSPGAEHNKQLNRLYKTPMPSATNNVPVTSFQIPPASSPLFCPSAELDLQSLYSQLPISYSTPPTEKPPSIPKEQSVNNSGDLQMIIETLGLLMSELRDMTEHQKSITALLQSVVSAQTSIDNRIQNLETNTLMITTALAKIDNQLSNIALSRPQIVAVEPPYVPEPPATEEPQPSGMSENDKKDIQLFQDHYNTYLKPLNLKAIDVNLYVSIQRMGGFKKYFARVYPGNTDVTHHLDLVNSPNPACCRRKGTNVYGNS